ncbi:Leucine-rich repeat-containing protein 51, partial [Coelomomyces lativittatus]
THSALKLSNNHLSQLTSFSSLLQKLHLIIDQLKWLDLSFNQFTSIDPSLQACTGLTHLYLHANQIEKITVIEKLSTFSFSKQLKSFAIHGNPVSQHKDCKRCVLLACPKLKHFDFCGVTKGDRSTAKYTGTKDHVVLAKS